MRFDWTKFMNRNNNIAVHCETEEEANDFCKKMHEHGLKWCGGKSYLSYNYWSAYKKDICYDNTGGYSPYDYYKNKNFTIFEWSDYVNDNSFTKADLKTGMIVTLRNGYEYMVLLSTESVSVNNTYGSSTDILVGKYRYNRLCNYNDDLTYGGHSFKQDPDYIIKDDIIKVELPYDPYAFMDFNYEKDKRTLLWERKKEPPVKEITMEELEKHFGCKVKIVKEN